jgi:hypothetical protein
MPSIGGRPSNILPMHCSASGHTRREVRGGKHGVTQQPSAGPENIFRGRVLIDKRRHVDPDQSMKRRRRKAAAFMR